jgi:hypothetical protein
VAAVKRSCKPAATPQGFPTSTQPQLDHPDLRCSNIIRSTTNKHTARTILLIWENITISCHRSPARQILGPLSKQHHQFTEHTAGTWPTQGTQSHDLGRVRVYGILELRGHGRGDLNERERCWEGFSLRTRGFVESRLLWPAELQHGFIVVVAYQVSKDRRQEDSWSPSQSLIKVTNKALLSTDMYICVDRSQTAQWRRLLVTRV